MYVRIVKPGLAKVNIVIISESKKQGINPCFFFV